MIMAERADHTINKNDKALSDDDQLSISDVEQHLASTSATSLDTNKNDNETEKAVLNTTGPFENQRREENPFSFKHFLKRETPSASNCASTSSASTYSIGPASHTGAKPKIFTNTGLATDVLKTEKCNHAAYQKRCEHCCPQYFKALGKTNSVENIALSNVDNHLKNLFRSYSDRDTNYMPVEYSPHDSVKANHSGARIASSEFSSALPDFVQDHIILEQWYSGFDNPLSTENVEREIKSVFSPFDKDYNKKNLKKPKDVTSTINKEENRGPLRAPLDLPINDSPPINAANPLDLPAAISLDLTGNVKDVIMHQDYNGMQEVPHILPDFLSDGAIHSDRLADLVQTSPKGQAGGMEESDSEDISETISRLSLENNRLRRELDHCRRQISEQSGQISRLQSELSISQKNEGQYTTKLATALETVEKNMARSNKRAIDAESTVAKLKKQISQMTSEMMVLRNENTSLRYGPAANDSNSMMRLSNELRTAASTAESSLRQLLTGVDNLRTLASSLESSNRIFEPSDDNFCENEDEDAGPAL
ncbi:uncharacterized protein LOC113365807 isoform X1 [Ctenocephalides felis]|uniref:uncharacterized protein LOC113365807 isoform X1 n=1 Tax=Ctenocephalides felis TaxID=7515 RepID=UPI000E6E2B99|nr:uncharacterized protein LOC113365807 isoform X1 [Ctenocephalides felis]